MDTSASDSRMLGSVDWIVDYRLRKLLLHSVPKINKNKRHDQFKLLQPTTTTISTANCIHFLLNFFNSSKTDLFQIGLWLHQQTNIDSFKWTSFLSPRSLRKSIFFFFQEIFSTHVYSRNMPTTTSHLTYRSTVFFFLPSTREKKRKSKKIENILWAFIIAVQFCAEMKNRWCA